MSEMRMFELECLRRRMEDERSQSLQRLARSQQEQQEQQEEVVEVEEITFAENTEKNSRGKTNNNGTIGGKTGGLEEIQEEPSKSEEDDDDNFTGHSCLLVTWKTNPEVEKFKVEKINFNFCIYLINFFCQELYMDDRGLSSVKTHKRKSKNLVDPGDLVSEKSLQKSYKILGQVIYKGLSRHSC